MGRIKKIEFYSHSYFGPHEKYVLDLDKRIMTKESREAIGVEEVTTHEKKISTMRLTTILSVLSKLNVSNFEDYYMNPYVMDGEQWSFQAYFDNGKVVESGGSNAYPKHFEEFRELFKPLEI